MTNGARRGFILATTMLVMTLLTVMLVAAFILISAEFHTTDASYSTARSLNLAQAGLEAYFAASHDLTTGSDSTNYGFSGGYARVVARQLRAATTSPSRNALWVVYATGVDSTRSITIKGTGTRTVARLAYLSVSGGTLPIRAAVMAANQIFIGDGINVTGYDNCTPSKDIVGVTASTSDMLAIPVHASALRGSPTGIQTLASRQAVYDSTHIAWDLLIGGGGFTTTAPSPGIMFKTYYYSGSLTLAPYTSYTGLLVLTGNLSLGNMSTWNGVIIAGGWVRSQSYSYVVNGAIVTGLNNMSTSGCSTSSASPCVGPDSLPGGGTGSSGTKIVWNSCLAASAIATIASLAPVRNAFMDTWKTY